MPIGRFLAGIAALIHDPGSDRYLLLRRAAHRDFGAESWECVAGRVDQGEGFEEALSREVREELGVGVRFEFFIGTTHFYRGEPVPENELVGVICCCSLDDPGAIVISDEHSQHRWLTATEAATMLPEGHWLVGVMEQAERVRQLASAELREAWRGWGLEIG